MRLLPLLFLASAAVCSAATFEIQDGDRVLLLGDALLERENTYGYLETRMQEQFPKARFTVRNLSWGGETPKGWARASFDSPAKGWARLQEQIAEVKPTVVFLGFGMAASLQELTDRSGDIMLNADPVRYGAEPMSAGRFKKELGELMDAIDKTAPAGKKVRYVLLSPIAHEDLRKSRPGLPDPAPHNALLKDYSAKISELAQERGGLFVAARGDDLAKSTSSAPPVTDNGIHLTEGGYRGLASNLAHSLQWTPLPVEKSGAGQTALRTAVLRKDDLFFHQFRPANSTYLFGFRKHEQGKNAAEMPQFTPLIEAVEKEIWELKQAAAPVPAGEPLSPPPAKPALAAAPTPLTIVTSQGRIFYGWRGHVFTNLADLAPQIRAFGQGPSAIRVAKNVPPPESPKVVQILKDLGVREPAIETFEDAPELPLPDFKVAEGFELTLWADTPLVGKPVGMNWDAAGRLWLACSPVYPQILPGAHPDDKVVVLEDTDRDGRADKSTTFGTNLLIATSVAPDFATPIVLHPPKDYQEEQEEEVDFLPLPGQPAPEKTSAPKPAAPKPKAPAAPRPSYIPATPIAPTAAYVATSTELVRLEDTNHDGVADERRIILSGFGTEDTHHVLHTLRWGPDGLLHFNQSIYIHSHLETPWGMVRVNSGAICTYDPRTERVEVTARGFVNTWGHAWDQYGQEFATDGAGGGGINWLIPGGMYTTYEGARKILPSVSPGGYPKFCSLELVQTPLFPADWQGNALTCDFRAHKLSRFQFTDLGLPVAGGKPSDLKSGYVTKELANPVTTSDASFRPIDLKLGPDGALYIADWTNPIINHGEVDFRDPRRDHIHGRVWRLAPKASTPVKWEPVYGRAIPKVMTDVLSDNQWTSEQALRVVSQRADALSLDPKMRRIAESNPEEINYLGYLNWLAWAYPLNSESQVYRSFSTFAAMGRFPRGLGYPGAAIGPGVNSVIENSRQMEERYLALLFKGSFQTRAAAVRLLASYCPKTFERGHRYEDSFKWCVDQLAHASRDEHPRVRLEAMRALARIPTVESAQLVLEASLKAPAGDPFYEYAAWHSVNDLAPQIIQWIEAQAAKTAATDSTPTPAQRDAMIAYALQALRSDQTAALLAKITAKSGVPKDGSGPWIELIGQAGGAVELRALLDSLLASTKSPGAGATTLAPKELAFTNPDAIRRAGAALVVAARRGSKPANVPLGKADFYLVPPAEAANDIIRLAGLWKENAAAAILTKVSPKADPALLDASFEALRTMGSAEATQALTAFLVPYLEKPASEAALHTALAKNSPDLRRRALTALATVPPEVALAATPGVLTETNGDATLALWRQLFTSDKYNAAFLAKPPTLTKEQAVPALRAARELGKRGEKLATALTPLTADPAAPGAPDLAALTALAKKSGDPVAGELIYRRAALTCTVCHAIGGAGGKVGPELMTIGASAPLDYIVESVLSPSVKVKEGYNAIALSLKGGQTLSGTVAHETDREIVLRDMVGAEQTVAKSTITERTNIGSLMPAGLTATLSDPEKAHLFAFLSQLGKPGPFDASKATTARTWRIFPGASVEAVVTGKADAKLGVAVLAYTDGRVTKELLEPAIAAAPGETILATTRFSLTAAGPTRLKLSGATKAWLDGAPLAIASDPNPVIALTAGDHTLAIKLDTKALPDILRAESPEARFITE